MDHTPDGLLLVDKAEGWTSHDVVAKARRALGTRKIGHAGTLDPMATGLLVLGIGPSTRLLTHLVGLDKTYTATIRLGHATVTDDREGERIPRPEEEREPVERRIASLAASPARVRDAVIPLTGEIEQVPSAVSAIKVDGRRAYDRVRSGEAVALKSRRVTVHSFEVGEPRRAADGLLEVDAVIRCSSGTYVRALARDLGASLGVGGHLSALRRTDVGPFSVAEAHPNAALVADDRTPPLDGTALLNPADVAARLFPVLSLTAQQAVDLGHGKQLAVDRDSIPDTRLAAAIGPSGRLVGLVSVERGRARAVTNFPQPEAGPGVGAAADGGES